MLWAVSFHNTAKILSGEFEMKFFSVDGKLYHFLSRFWDMLKLNFFWVLFSLPIVTIGAATTAAFSVTLKMIDENEGYIFSSFLKAFKENWKKGSIIGLLNLVFIYALYLDFELFNKVEGNPIYFVIFGIVGIAICIGSFLYAYALTARYENTILNTLKNSMDISIKYFLRTLMVVIVIAIECVVFYFSSTTIFIGLLIGPATVFLTISGPALYIFRDIEKKQKEG